MQTIIFIHGFASSAGSKKAIFFDDKFRAIQGADFRALDLNPTPLDFEFQTTTGHVSRLRQYLLDHALQRVSIIASSYGGLIAVHYAHRFGGIDRMLLLAPGLRWLSGGLDEAQLVHWEQAGAVPAYHEAFRREIPVRYDLHLDGLSYLEMTPPASPTTIVHGSRDVTVPVDDSRQYASRYPDMVQLIEVDADHDLNGHLDLIWQYAAGLLPSS